MGAAVSHSYHTVGETVRGHRIWIENRILEKNGITAGSKYKRTVDAAAKIITIEISNDDSADDLKTVSAATNGTPIIYILNQEVTELYGDHKKIMATYSQGRVVISLHHLCSKSQERAQRFNDNLKKGTLTEGTFCVGVGMATLGIHEGFKKHGINVETKWILDREQRYLDAALKNNPAVTQSTAAILGKMEEIDPRLISPVDIFQFSMSCRVHSQASRAKQKRAVAEDHEDAAGVYGLFKSLEHINAAVIISENVKEAKDSATYLILKAVLKELGYRVHEFILNNQQSGSFENRTRYWLVAIDENLPDLVPEALPHYGRKFNTFGDIGIALNLDSSQLEWKTHSAARAEKIARDTEKGNGFSSQSMLTESSTSAPSLRREYLKNGSTDINVAGDNGTYRMVTEREHCLFKSAPLGLIEGLPKTLAHEVLGQGVDMGQSIGIAELVCLSVTQQVTQTATIYPFPKQAQLF